jgi:hypothetical protein
MAFLDFCCNAHSLSVLSIFGFRLLFAISRAMRRFVLLLLCLLLFVGCELVKSILGELGGENRVVDRALKSPNESIQQEATEVKRHATECSEEPIFRGSEDPLFRVN